MIAFIVCVLCADDPRLLKYSFAAGDSWVHTQTIKVESLRVNPSDGVATEETIDMTESMRTKVMSVADDGTARVVKTQTRLRAFVKTDGNEGGVDSSDEHIPDSLKDYFRVITTSEISMSVRPNGEVFDVRLPNRLKTALKSKTRGEPGYISETKLVRQMESPYILPNKALTIGDAWEDDPWTGEMDGIRTMNQRRQVFEGPVERGGRRFLRIAESVKFRNEVPPATTPASNSKFVEQWSRGHVLLDANNCLLVEKAQEGLTRRESLDTPPRVTLRIAVQAKTTLTELNGKPFQMPTN